MAGTISLLTIVRAIAGGSNPSPLIASQVIRSDAL
jgi:hypothetical protein